ncbi:transport and Golgi organization protein 11 [Agrilus planipennis]|uniref:Transport and Golgi organization protein 11 n=1 Tax=Agrilus planipennis TaxID=224129 RepID=A0A1W4WK23_AGRPL|nr:transport and Golgi organization protein 11 [Agrilus planipennis]
MSNNASPEHYNELEDAFMSDATFKVDISQKMKVPSKISFGGDTPNGINLWSSSEAINMQVPERILVVGQHQHIGTRAPPREIIYDNSILPNDQYTNEVRVATPPRTLTLDKYPFPRVSAEEEEPEEEEKEFAFDRIPVVRAKTKFDLNESLNDSRISLRESTPPIGHGEKLTPAEEIYHLRCQMAKLNRRIMALELENLNRLQREKILYGMGIAYFLLKAIIWLNRY